MGNRKSVFAVCGALGLALLMVTSSHAWVGQKNLSYLTFNGVVALPGGTLAAGTYIFELADQRVANLVRVSSRDRARVYFLLSTRTSQRPREMSVDRTVVLGESVPGTPPPIKAWYPAGEQVGHEFVY